MSQQFGSGQNGYLKTVAKAASSFVEGENRSKPKKDKDSSFVSKLEGQAITAIGAKLFSGDVINATSNPRNVGHLVNKLSSWNQDKRRNSYQAKNQGMEYGGYDERSNNMNGGYSYDGYGGGSGWGGGSPSVNRGYGYDQARGYGGDGGRQGYYDNGTSYEGYGNRSRMSDGYDGSYGNPPLSRGGYGYA